MSSALEVKTSAAIKAGMFWLEEVALEEGGDASLAHDLSDAGQALYRFGTARDWPVAETFYRQFCELTHRRPIGWRDLDPRIQAAFAAFAANGRAVDRVLLDPPPGRPVRRERTEPNHLEVRIVGPDERQDDPGKYYVKPSAKKPPAKKAPRRKPAAKKTGGRKGA